MPEGLGQLQLSFYYGVLIRQWKVIAGFTAALFVTVMIATATSTRYYSSNAVVEVRPEAPIIMENITQVTPQASIWHLERFYDTQRWIITSKDVMNEAVRELQEVHGIEDFNELPEPALFLAALTSSSMMGNTHLMKIEVVYTDPDKAALFANAVAKAYEHRNLEQQLEASRAALEWLSEQQEIYRRQKYESDKRLEEQLAAQGLSSEQSRTVSAETLEKLRSAWSDAHTRRITEESVAEGLREQYRQGDLLALADHISAPNSVTESVLRRYREAQQSRAALLSRLTPQHPDVIRVDEQLQSLRQQLDEQVRAYIEGQETAVRLVRQEEEALAVEIQEISQQMAGQAGDVVSLRFLSQQAERDAQFYKDLDERRTEVGLQQYLQANNVRVVGEAIPRGAPIRPKVGLNLAAGLLVGLLGGAALALGVELTDTTVKTREDVERASGVPLLGFVPLVSADQIEDLARDIDRNLFAYAHAPFSDGGVFTDDTNQPPVPGPRECPEIVDYKRVTSGREVIPECEPGCDRRFIGGQDPGH